VVMRRKVISILILMVSGILILSGCGESKLSAQEKRNNFDACKIEFVKKVPQANYKADPSNYDKQAEQGCSPLLTAEQSAVESFSAPSPSIAPVQKQASFEDFCALMKKAAFAHLEFGKKYLEDNSYEEYYLRVQSYMIKGGALLRTMDGNNDSLISDAQDASTNAYGFNGTWAGAEGRLYAACGISKDSVTKSADKMFGY
jgi:hypothetical protein